MGLRALLGALLMLGPATAIAHPARGIAVAEDGRVYYSDLTRVWTIAPNGARTLVRDAGGRHMHELALPADGDLLVEESEYAPATGRYRAAIFGYRPGRGGRHVYGPTASPEPGVGVFRDPSGCTYQSDETSLRKPVLYRRCPGRPIRRLGEAAGAPRVLLSNRAGAAFGPEGRFYFRRGTRVHRLNSDDSISTVARGIADENFGIAVDADRSVLVVEHDARRIVRIDPAGRRSIAARSEAPWRPTGVAAARGALYVLEVSEYRAGEASRTRVRRLSPGVRPRLLAIGR